VGISIFPLITVPTKLMIDPQAGMVYSTLSGDVAAPDLMRHIASIRAHPDFDSSFNELVDATQLHSINLTSEDVRAFAMQDSPFLPSSKRVLVASEDLIFGLARMFQVFGGDSRPNFDVVRTLAEARKRLGINDSGGAQ
jgi:hypothetical protein